MMARGESYKTKLNNMEPHFYNVNLNWDKERRGTLCSPEIKENGGSCIEVATPPEFPKGIRGIWSPEHFFTAAVNSCLMTTFLSIAENSRLNFTSFSSKAKGKLEQIDGKFIMSEIILEPTLTITDEKDRDKAERILHKSEAACLISNSIISKITLITNIKIA
jgi:organic hydroperoxide reductase OsmC/OhrA